MFQPNFPLGYSTRETVHEYLQHNPQLQLYVPIMVFIDRKGMIRHQYPGDDPFFQNQDANLRTTIEEMLNANPAPKKTGLTRKKKAS